MISLAIIPARGGSKGIPRKNVQLLAGKPLIAHTIEHAQRACSVNRVVVSTDDPEIALVAEQYGAEVVRRPAGISDDTASSESALLHALDYLKESEGYEPDLVVFLQCTSPLRRPNDIDDAISKIIEDGADSLLSLTESQEFIWKRSESGFASMTFDYKNRKRRQELEPMYYENGSIYVFKPEVLKTYNNRLGGIISVYLMEPWQRVDIDDYDSLRWCERLYWTYLAGERSKSILSEIQLIVYDFDGVMTDNKVTIDQFGNESVTVTRADGLAISRIRDLGMEQIILSSEENPVVRKRAEKLGLPCIYAKKNKKEVLREYLERNQISKDKVAFVGNDINDIEVMNFVGYPIAPSDAHEEIRRSARITTRTKGGNGVIRELLDVILGSVI